ncbi:polyphosphate kinase 2 family protein [Daejeonella oryzae]|uniref:polyphosphate kinase 2 family protein n=1 Tax=Daejeonella oryzae TaxID=1122943 RepID=UPI000425C802|nr:polyphosphate kinase 2 family protein [Daejeonella oryzae]
MDEFINHFRIQNEENFALLNHDPKFSGDHKKSESENVLNDYKNQMDELQEKLYATNRYSLLIIFQAMDAAGKDSAIEHVMSGINPQGCQVFSFKQPNSEEYEHDFLWRHNKALPEKGRIGIHNRSHYENVLVCKVHPEYLKNEGFSYPFKSDEEDEKFWKSRYESIINFEKHLSANGTVILKFFLNVSKKEQKERFLERINDPLKNWKFSSGDVKERERWDDYMKVYEEAIRATSTENAPWYIIPADKKWFTRIAISKIIVETLKSLNLQLPELSEDEKGKLEESKNQLMKE